MNNVKKLLVAVAALMVAFSGIALAAAVFAAPVQASDDAPRIANIEPEAIDEYTKASKPKLHKLWGDAGLLRIQAAVEAAADTVSKNPKCDVVYSTGYSYDRSTPKSKIVTFVDCRNGERFYIEEGEQAAPTGEQEKLDSLDNSELMLACRDLVRRKATVPSSVSISALFTESIRRQFGIETIMPFEAKNAYGVTIRHRAICFTGSDGATTLRSIRER